ncbi:single-stranded DNA-binding protein [Nocardioides aromaticivorans]|nr:single-stranded DNA-binding protein [Nocardioides aromaticivorans]
MLPTITIDGRLVDDPELRFTQGGKAVASFRVAASDSKKDASGNWETNERVFIGVSLWEGDAEEAAETLGKGDRVLISGRLFEREYEKRDGGTGKSLEMKFPTVAKVVAAKRGQRATSAAPARASSSAAGDPWGTAPVNDEPPF